MTDERPGGSPPHRAIRSFVVRGGRITEAQERALVDLWPRFGLEHGAEPLDLDAVYGRSAPRIVEIGFGNGENLAALARARPDVDVLGIEVHRPGVGRLLLTADQLGLANLRVVCHDAVEVLGQRIAPGSFDQVLIFVPDPWHKKRHHKRRLVQPEFASLVASRLKAGGILRLATDWEPYALHMLEVLDACPELRNVSADGRFVPQPAERISTRFERRGLRLGHGVWDLAYARR